MSTFNQQFILEVLAWTLLAISFVVAVMGTVLPGIPGAVFVVFGVLLHKWLIPETFSWMTIGSLAALAFASWMVDFFSGVMGAKLGGASKAGLIGASLGSLSFFIIGFPGLIIGPFFGAILGDLYAQRTNISALLRSGAGAALGFFISVFARLVILSLMGIIVLFAIMM